jgi:hypothetical protein
MRTPKPNQGLHRSWDLVPTGALMPCFLPWGCAGSHVKRTDSLKDPGPCSKGPVPGAHKQHRHVMAPVAKRHMPVAQSIGWLDGKQIGGSPGQPKKHKHSRSLECAEVSESAHPSMRDNDNFNSVSPAPCGDVSPLRLTGQSRSKTHTRSEELQADCAHDSEETHLGQERHSRPAHKAPAIISQDALRAERLFQSAQATTTLE